MPTGASVRLNKAQPDSWMTNNDDPDTFDTQERDQSQCPGTVDNAVIDLEPREIQPTRP